MIEQISLMLLMVFYTFQDILRYYPVLLAYYIFNLCMELQLA